MVTVENDKVGSKYNNEPNKPQATQDYRGLYFLASGTWLFFWIGRNIPVWLIALLMAINFAGLMYSFFV